MDGGMDGGMDAGMDAGIGELLFVEDIKISIIDRYIYISYYS
jgi:hypothetical protein